MKNTKKILLACCALLMCAGQCHAEKIIYDAKLQNPPHQQISAGASVAEFTQDADKAGNSGMQVRFPYMDNQVYQVYLQTGYITDIRFEPNEVIKYVAGGDTERWKIDSTIEGEGYGSVAHLFVKPIMENISTNLIVNTNKRVYQLMLVSGKKYNAMVSWEYSGSASRSGLYSDSEVKNYSEVNPTEMDFGYKIKGSGFDWAPESIFRSGSKTYLQMKPEVFDTDLPTLFVINDEGKKELVSYRYDNGMYVVDRLVKHGVLLLGKKVVEFEWKGAK